MGKRDTQEGVWLTFPDVLGGLHGPSVNKVLEAPRVAELGSLPSVIDGLKSAIRHLLETYQ